METRQLHAVIASIKRVCVDGLGSPHLVDLAFIGNASDVYAWIPTPNVDLDVCFIVRALEHDCGTWLLEQAARMRELAGEAGIPFELRIINGPYKPTPDRSAGPAIVLHAAVFTERNYSLQPALLRWSWRKYKCVAVPERFSEWAPGRPGARELLDGPIGIRKRLAAIDAGTAVFYEQQLPSFEWTEFTAAVGDNLFTEYCFAAVADSARNHGRVIGSPEADALSNQDYTNWYARRVFPSASFSEAMRLKLQARQNGYAGLSKTAHRLARDFLRALCAHLEASH